MKELARVRREGGREGGRESQMLTCPLLQGFQDYFSESSLPPLSPVSEAGHWRQVTVRCYSTGESMAVVQMHPQDLSQVRPAELGMWPVGVACLLQEQLSEEKQKLADFFRGAERGRVPTSLYFQLMGRK